MTSPWSVPIFNNLTIPTSAGPGMARIVIASQLPPPLDTYVPTQFVGATGFAGAIIFYSEGDDTSYNFIAVVEDAPGGDSPVTVYGTVNQGVVMEQGFNSDAGNPAGLILAGTPSGTGMNLFLRTNDSLQIDAENTSVFAEDGLNISAGLGGLPGTQEYRLEMFAGLPFRIQAGSNGMGLLLVSLGAANNVQINSDGEVNVAATSNFNVSAQNAIALISNGLAGTNILATGGNVDLNSTLGEINLNAGTQIRVMGNQGWLITELSTTPATALLALVAAVPTAVPGAAKNVVTATTNATWQVHATFDFEETVAGNSIARGYLYVDGVQQPGLALFECATVNDRACISQTWSGQFAVAGLHSFELRADKSAAAGTINANAIHTKLSITLGESGG